MALTDLTGTTWTLNDSLTSYAGGTYSLKTYSVNITTETPLPTYNGDADTFVMLTVGYDSGGETNVAQVYTTSPASWDNVAMFATGHDTKTLPDTWSSGYYEGTFTVTGGTDATNSTLIAWMEDNCTQYVPPTPPTPDVVVTYEGANIVELSEAGTKTLKTAGKYLTDDVVLAYSGGSGGGGGMLVTFTTPDSGETYTADKTFGEIFAAFDSGIQPVFKFVSSSASATYTTIKDASKSGSSTPYGILFSTFYTTRLWGAANDYPSWSSDN